MTDKTPAKGRRAPVRLRGAEREVAAQDCARRYRSGQTVDQIVADTDLTYGTVHRLLKEKHVEMRKPGIKTPVPRPTPQQEADILCRYLAGATLRALVEETGFTDFVIRKVIANAGVEIRVGRRLRLRHARLVRRGRLTNAGRGRLADELARRFTGGETTEQLTRVTKLSERLVRQLIREAGVPPLSGRRHIRPPG